MKTAEMFFFEKHASTLGVAVVGGPRRSKKTFLFFNLVHLNCQKVSSRWLKAFLPYLRKCTLGGGGGGLLLG